MYNHDKWNWDSITPHIAPDLIEWTVKTISSSETFLKQNEKESLEQGGSDEPVKSTITSDRSSYKI